MHLSKPTCIVILPEPPENSMRPARDPAPDRMTEIVRSPVEIMYQGRMPAVDLVDERLVLIEGGRGFSGIGEASGRGAARRAMALAIDDLTAQVRPVR